MEKHYNVRITRHAYNQMKDIRQYIEEELFAPDAAKNLLMNMKDEIGKLESMLTRHQFVEEEPWRTEGISWLIVKNFYILLD